MKEEIWALNSSASEVETTSEINENRRGNESDPEIIEIREGVTELEVEEIRGETGPEDKEGATSCPVLEITNVCSRFNLRCKLDLFDVAAKSISIEYNEGSVRKLWEKLSVIFCY